MSFALMTYVVDLDTLNSSIGSKNDELCRMIGDQFKRHLADYDRQFDDDLAIHEAIRAVIDGGPFDQQYGYKYAYAYRWICAFHGRALDNRDFSPMGVEWLDMVDGGLRELDVPAVRLGGFSGGFVPSPIPSPDDMFPSYGEWSLTKCRKALEHWESVNDERKAALDPEVLEAVESCMGWCETAATDGRGVAGFLS